MKKMTTTDLAELDRLDRQWAKMTTTDLAELDRQWAAMTDKQKITLLRREAERLRASKQAERLRASKQDGGFFTTEQLADICDDYADHIETGELEEEESPEQLMAEVETLDQLLDLLKRHDAGCLDTLVKRWNKSSD